MVKHIKLILFRSSATGKMQKCEPIFSHSHPSLPTNSPFRTFQNYYDSSGSIKPTYSTYTRNLRLKCFNLCPLKEENRTED